MKFSYFAVALSLQTTSRLVQIQKQDIEIKYERTDCLNREKHNRRMWTRSNVLNVATE